MDSLINTKRPPVFCPGCAHEKILYALDKTFSNMGLAGDKVAMVSDIGCSGLFDTFFNTHAFHGLHGRALTYAAGIKLAKPELNVIVTMGDGGLGIGGAHLLEACRRNLNITLLILNNFNFGMTGGQFSSTTPPDAVVGSGFLNNLEKPFDVCQVAAASGAVFVTRCSGYVGDLSQKIEAAINHKGFSLVDIWGICPGRFTKNNPLTPKVIEERLAALPKMEGVIEANVRKAYSEYYKEIASGLKPAKIAKGVKPEFTPLYKGTSGVLMLGSAGQRIITAGEILCYAGLKAGMFSTVKSDYNITVLRGHSVTEAILSDKKIAYTGSKKPNVVIAVDAEGVARKKSIFKTLSKDTLVIASKDLEIPETDAQVMSVDFKELKIKYNERALASLAIMAKLNKIISYDMLLSALKEMFNEKVYNISAALVASIRYAELK